MVKSKLAFQELRVDFRQPEATEIFIYLDNLGNVDLAVGQGWHYKSFPSSISLMEILQACVDGKEQPATWSHKSPTTIHKG